MKVGLIHIPYVSPSRTHRQTFEWSIRLAVEADQAGVAEMMITEHATEAWEPIPNPEMVISAAALETERIKFAPMAHLLPYHNPASLAIQVGWLSRILEGRYFLGVGAGAYPNDGLVRGHNDLSENHLMLQEALDIMQRVWKREPFFFEGKYFRAGFPKQEEPINPGDEDHLITDFAPWGGSVDIAVTGLSVNSSSMKIAGANGYIPVSVYSGAANLKAHWETYAAAARAKGLTPNQHLHHVSHDVVIADTDREAKDLAINGGLGETWQRYLVPLFNRMRPERLQGFVDEVPGATMADVNLEWLAEHVWIVGSPETVLERMEALFDASGGWGTLQLQTHDYIDDPAPWLESMRRLVDEVAPKLELPSS
jgi:alkanesulfonate monooxygenase SsuD/methylene tetrahydromethanopterin reductase-like flavin-dependent oxidoreductase (luciferase family)